MDGSYAGVPLAGRPLVSVAVLGSQITVPWASAEKKFTYALRVISAEKSSDSW
jgi:hypothetical protein